MRQKRQFEKVPDELQALREQQDEPNAKRSDGFNPGVTSEIDQTKEAQHSAPKPQNRKNNAYSEGKKASTLGEESEAKILVAREAQAHPQARPAEESAGGETSRTNASYKPRGKPWWKKDWSSSHLRRVSKAAKGDSRDVPDPAIDPSRRGASIPRDVGGLSSTTDRRGLELISKNGLYGTTIQVEDGTGRRTTASSPMRRTWTCGSRSASSCSPSSTDASFMIFYYGQTVTGKTYTMSNSSSHAIDGNEAILTRGVYVSSTWQVPMILTGRAPSPETATTGDSLRAKERSRRRREIRKPQRRERARRREELGARQAARSALIVHHDRPRRRQPGRYARVWEGERL
ncbi:hypothetical protein CHU98_g6809 [Xylaria longipes]|nr:hypothetical protein CHU98_g6809 [Xylaria longipes]